VAARLVRGSLLNRHHPLSSRFRSQSLKAQFKKPGKHGMNIFRAILITGPPGIGKTTAAHICAKLEGFTVIELNASDARSKKLIEVCSLMNPVLGL
jgi:DNA polymerase III delta prime subunit